MSRLLTVAGIALPLFCVSHAGAIQTPGCEASTPKECIEQALTAMGGEEKLQSIHSIQFETVSHIALTEQSYRQDPFITAYTRSKSTIDFSDNRIRTEERLTWPESDPHQSEIDTTLIATPSGGVYHSEKGDAPCSPADLDNTRSRLELGPLRLLLTALQADDLHYEKAETIRSTEHAVLAFTWNKLLVRILLNRYNHLPDAIETTFQPQDFWFYWGDVKQRVYWDNWQYAQGIVYPTNEITERNGVLWQSAQALDIQFNVPVDDKNFAMDEKAARQSGQQKSWERPFKNDKTIKLAEGIDLYRGSWNTTIVRQPDGVVILETPISGTFTQGIFEEAQKKYPGAKIQAVLSSSDSWPHVGGVRFDVSQGMPVYILDLNQPLLDRMIAAPHHIHPDALETSPRKPDWKIVSGKVELGSGPNRMELYPLRGASTERQYMVYFPEHRLLYASDTLVVNPDKTLYDPQLMHEVRQAVEREHLKVDTVYAMHEGPMRWADVIAMLKKAS
jgi:hypothetical protein